MDTMDKGDTMDAMDWLDYDEQFVGLGEVDGRDLEADELELELEAPGAELMRYHRRIALEVTKLDEAGR
jgi:hypothetical protein